MLNNSRKMVLKKKLNKWHTGEIRGDIAQGFQGDHYKLVMKESGGSS